ncbi:MAG: rod shape-determining protein MreC [Solirubrobacteraceae bacterium]|jgi:rod shape-determining protein MreC|nr:rod shape-determining protein MreC [Solirubrobacteraceae bacterium]
MHDRVVRRRRAVLAALVALSLILLTAYFGESSGGGLHAVQRGAMEVLAPIQEGANRALKPARDLFGWFGDTLGARGERDKLRAERDRLRRAYGDLSVRYRDTLQRQGLQAQNTTGGLAQYQPVSARVYQRSPSSWYQTALINRGSSDGIRVDQPVVNDAGLVGRVKSVSDGNAQILLLTDETFGVSAKVAKTGDPGVIGPVQGTPGDLLLDLVPKAGALAVGDLVITAGTTTARLPSPFPAGIPIGEVTRVDVGEGDLDRRIHVAPVADMRRLDLVEVLTQPQADVRAQVP